MQGECGKTSYPGKGSAVFFVLAGLIACGLICCWLTGCGLSDEGEAKILTLEAEDILSVPQSSPAQEENPEVSEVMEVSEVSDVPMPVSDYTIVYTGDVCLHSGVEKTYGNAGVSGIIGEELLRELTEADYTVINHEFCFSIGGEKQDKTYTFRSDPQNVGLLREMGVDLASLANNHALDYGPEALSDTFVTLDDAGIAYMGAGETAERAEEMITTEVNGYTMGFLAASRVYPTAQWNVTVRQPGMLSAYNADDLAQVVAEKAAQSDYLTVYLHWGIEREEYPEDYERSLARLLIDSGADAIIGSHPHVLQGVEYYRGRPIFYSLGNFVFNASLNRTAVLRATVDLSSAGADEVGELADHVTWQMVPCITVGYCTEEIKDEAAVKSFYEYMRSISYDVDFDVATGRVCPPL